MCFIWEAGPSHNLFPVGSVGKNLFRKLLRATCDGKKEEHETDVSIGISSDTGVVLDRHVEERGG